MQIIAHLAKLAHQIMQKKDLEATMKVERQVNKAAAVTLLSSQIGTVFKGIITGASDKGTWVRIFQPAVEGKIIQGFQNLNIGDKVSVQLKHVDMTKGFIDFIFLNKKA